MADWFRWWHGTVTDPKFRLIARRTGASKATVIAVWAALLEKVSSNTFSFHDLDDDLDLDEGTSERIIKAFEQRGMIENGRIVKWSRYKAINTNRPSSEIWRKIRKLIFKRDNYTCQYCGEYGKKLECDHIIPVSKGGTHEESNLVTSCFKCNRSKKSKLIKEWRGK